MNEEEDGDGDDKEDRNRDNRRIGTEQDREMDN